MCERKGCHHLSRLSTLIGLFHYSKELAARSFEVDDKFMVLNGQLGTGRKRIQGVVVQRLEPISYIVECQGRLCQVHVHHLKRYGAPTKSTPLPAVPTSSTTTPTTRTMLASTSQQTNVDLITFSYQLQHRSLNQLYVFSMWQLESISK